MSNLSGAAWWNENQAKYPNSNNVEDLVSPFREKVKFFLNGLYAGGAQIIVSSTLRSSIRAYLMHYSWYIAKGLIPPEQVPMSRDCDIFWIHSTPQESIEAAQEMVNLFGMAYEAILDSRHVEGLAIDMNISWQLPLMIPEKGTGKLHRIEGPGTDRGNQELYDIGSTYGVYKLLSDPPHWSVDGH